MTEIKSLDDLFLMMAKQKHPDADEAALGASVGRMLTRYFDLINESVASSLSKDKMELFTAMLNSDQPSTATLEFLQSENVDLDLASANAIRAISQDDSL